MLRRAPTQITISSEEVRNFQDRHAARIAAFLKARESAVLEKRRAERTQRTSHQPTSFSSTSSLQPRQHAAATTNRASQLQTARDAQRPRPTSTSRTLAQPPTRPQPQLPSNNADGDLTEEDDDIEMDITEVDEDDDSIAQIETPLARVGNARTAAEQMPQAPTRLTRTERIMGRVTGTTAGRSGAEEGSRMR